MGSAMMRAAERKRQKKLAKKRAKENPDAAREDNNDQ